MLVYVLSKNGDPLMPCSCGKASRLLNRGCAKVVSRTPFTIQLLYGSSGYKQPLTLSVDTGSKVIGVAVTGNGKTYYASEVQTRSDISKKLTQRKSYRRTRRGRKTRYRAARWANRRRTEGWLTPTLRSKVRAHIKEVEHVQSILPITKTVVETASFDIHKIVNPQVSSKGYLEGRQKDYYNARQFVLSRDRHTCQKCSGKKKDPKLHVHHIIFRSQGGTNSPDNLVTLCETCHDHLHITENAARESLKLRKKISPPTLDAVQVSTISSYLRKELFFEETFGYETKYKREKLNLPKEHYLDAICIGLSENETVKLPDVVYKKRCVALGDYQQRCGSHSEQIIPTGKIMGFKKFDKVEWQGRELFIKGRISTGYAVLMDINSQAIPLKPMAKMRGMKRISARNSCLTTLVHIENSPLNIISSLSASTKNHSSLYKELVNL